MLFIDALRLLFLPEVALNSIMLIAYLVIYGQIFLLCQKCAMATQDNHGLFTMILATIEKYNDISIENIILLQDESVKMFLNDWVTKAKNCIIVHYFTVKVKLVLSS